MKKEVDFVLLNWAGSNVLWYFPLFVMKFELETTIATGQLEKEKISRKYLATYRKRA